MKNDPIVVRRDQSFVWVIFDPRCPFFEGLSKPSVSRMMYLATFIGKEGVIENTNSYRTGRPLTQKEIVKRLGCSEQTFLRFVKEMKGAGILSSERGVYRLSVQHFRKGVLTSEEIDAFWARGEVFTRLYIGAMRSLYNLSLPNLVSSLSYLFRMMPFVNCEYNVVTTSPFEEDIFRDEPMSMGDFADIVGYRRSHMSHLCNVLESLRFMADDGPAPVIRQVCATRGKTERIFWWIDPRLYYGGTQLLS